MRWLPGIFSSQSEYGRAMLGIHINARILRRQTRRGLYLFILSLKYIYAIHSFILRAPMCFRRTSSPTFAIAPRIVPVKTYSYKCMNINLSRNVIYWSWLISSKRSFETLYSTPVKAAAAAFVFLALSLLINTKSGRLHLADWWCGLYT